MLTFWVRNDTLTMTQTKGAYVLLVCLLTGTEGAEQSAPFVYLDISSYLYWRLVRLILMGTDLKSSLGFAGRNE
jgi:hypothetical protein